MSTHPFFWLLIVLILSLVLLQLRHRNTVAVQIRKGVADARDILDSTAEGIITTNSAGEIQKFNLAAESVFGYKAANVIGKNFLLLLPPETHGAHRHTMSGTGSDTVTGNIELMARRSDGEHFPIALTVKPIRQKGETGFLGMFRDISARKLAEVNSYRSQHFMEFLLQSSAVVFYTCNLKRGTNISYVSPNVEKLLGYKPETVTAAAAFWSLHVHPDDRERIQSWRISRMTGDREDLEYRLKMADGSYHWFADSRTLINDENGEPNLLIGCWTDIEIQKEMEFNLAKREECLRISLKCAKLATWDWFINKDVITWSGNIQENLGTEVSVVRNFEGFSAIAHPEDRETLQSAFRDCLVQDEPLDIEYRVVWPDKSIHWVHLAGELINDEIGSPVHMAGALSDITPQKQLRVAAAPGMQAASKFHA